MSWSVVKVDFLFVEAPRCCAGVPPSEENGLVSLHTKFAWNMPPKGDTTPNSPDFYSIPCMPLFLKINLGI